MSSLTDSFHHIRVLDDLSCRKSYMHSLHPLIKLLTTIVFLVVVLSFDKYEVLAMLPLCFFPFIVFSLGEIPARPIITRILLSLPIVLGIGIFNPIFEHQTVSVAGLQISIGWISFLSLFLKCTLTVSAALLLLATTGMDKLAHALRMIYVPKIFVLQLLLTYRYISVLLEEAITMMNAYFLRAPNQKGIHKSAWGSMMGQLILRAFDRADSVYQAMRLRGFSGEYHSGDCDKVDFFGLLFFLIWSLFFIFARVYNIPELIGAILMGGLS